MSPEHIALQAVVDELCAEWMRSHVVDLTVHETADELVSA